MYHIYIIAISEVTLKTFMKHIKVKTQFTFYVIFEVCASSIDV